MIYHSDMDLFRNKLGFGMFKANIRETAREKEDKHFVLIWKVWQKSKGSNEMAYTRCKQTKES